MRCSCKQRRLGMKDWHAWGLRCNLHNNGRISPHRCTVRTHSQHVNIISHPHTSTRGEYRNDLPIFPLCLNALLRSLTVIMLLRNKQMPSFIRHLQQQFLFLTYNQYHYCCRCTEVNSSRTCRSFPSPPSSAHRTRGVTYLKKVFSCVHWVDRNRLVRCVRCPSPHCGITASLMCHMGLSGQQWLLYDALTDSQGRRADLFCHIRHASLQVRSLGAGDCCTTCTASSEVRRNV